MLDLVVKGVALKADRRNQEFMLNDLSILLLSPLPHSK
jgi:hypothetical protein